MFNLAIIGRPNVGKSTFFNRLARKKLAIVEDRPGVTRDWRDAPAEIGGRDWIIIDTAGLEEGEEGSIEARMRAQSEAAIQLADVIIMMIDVRAGITPSDRHFATLVRKTGKPVILLANKCEGREAESGLYNAFELGLGEPIGMSAEHGNGMGDFIDRLEDEYKKLCEQFPDHVSHDMDDDDEEDDGESDTVKSLKIAIIGRPNAGKSTLVNALVQENRMMTGPEAGITRDSIAIEWDYKDTPIRLVDTAGIRKKAKIDDVLEKTMVQEGFRAVRLAHIVIWVSDGTLSLDKQDLSLAKRVVDEGRALIIAVNKWDAIKNKDEKIQEVTYRVEESIAQLKDVPIVPISALKGKNLERLMDEVIDLYGLWNMRISTGQLNRWLDAMTQAHPAPLASGRPNRVKYMTQIKSRPPTFAMFVSRPDELPESYKRYIVNGLRQRFNLPSVPIRVHLRTSDNPYVNS